MWFVRHGTGPTINRPAELVLEDGTRLKAVERLPPDLPLGYHDLHPDDGGATTRLIVTPERCHVRDGGSVVGMDGAAVRGALVGRVGASATSPTCARSLVGPRSSAPATSR